MGTAAEDQALYLPYSHICKTWSFRNHHSSSFFQKETFPLAVVTVTLVWGYHKIIPYKSFPYFQTTFDFDKL